MDVRFINPFISAIQSVFKTMVNSEVAIKKPYMLDSNETASDVSGVIGFSGDASGCVVLSFNREIACKVASAFAGVDINLDHPDFADAIGELANMVAGNAKKDFTGLKVSISLPSVIVGPDHKVQQLKAAPRLIIPCETKHGPFNVEVSMIIGKSGAAAGSKPATAAVS